MEYLRKRWRYETVFDLKSTKYENWLGSGRRPLNNHQLSQWTLTECSRSCATCCKCRMERHRCLHVPRWVRWTLVTGLESRREKEYQSGEGACHVRNSRDGVRWERVIKLQLEKWIYFTWPYEEDIGIKGVWECSYETQLNEHMNLQSGRSPWHQGWDAVRGEPWNGSKFPERKNREWREGCRTKPAKCLHSRSGEEKKAEWKEM